MTTDYDERAYPDREVDIDLGDTDDDTPPWYISPGNYPFRCYSAVLREGRKGDYIELVWDTLKDGQHRKFVRDRLSLGKNAAWKMRKTRKAMGLPYKGKLRIKLDEFLGIWGYLTISEEQFRGRTQARVEDIEPLEDSIPDDWIERLNEQAAEFEEGGEGSEGEESGDVGTGYAAEELPQEDISDTPFDGAEAAAIETGGEEEEEDELPW